MKALTDRQIRQHYGHGYGSRRVRITRTGEVHYYGSTEDTDRQHDYWHYAGTRDQIAAQAASDASTTNRQKTRR